MDTLEFNPIRLAQTSAFYWGRQLFNAFKCIEPYLCYISSHTVSTKEGNAFEKDFMQWKRIPPLIGPFDFPENAAFSAVGNFAAKQRL